MVYFICVEKRALSDNDKKEAFMIKLIRRIGPVGMMGIKVTALGALFWFAWAFSGYQGVYLLNNGFSASQTGLLNAISFGVIIISVSFWGRISDKIGSLKRVVFIILLFGAGLYALIPLIPLGKPYTPVLFFTIIPLMNFFKGPAGTMEENLQVRNCNDLHLNYGLSRSAGSLFYTLGGLLAAFLLGKYIEVKDTFLLTFILIIPVMVMVVFVREPHGRSKSSAKDAEDQSKVMMLFKNRKYTSFLIFALLFYTAYNCSNAFVPYYMESIGVDNSRLGFFLAYRAFLEMPLLLLMNRLRRKFSLTQLIIAGVVLIMVESLLLGSFVGSFFGIMAATTMYGLGNGLFIGTTLNYLYKLAPAALRASAQAYFSAVSSVAGIAGNLLGGLLFDIVGAKPFYLVVSGIYLVSILVFALSSRIKKVESPQVKAG